jgi:hypothetical protein
MWLEKILPLINEEGSSEEKRNERLRTAVTKRASALKKKPAPLGRWLAAGLRRSLDRRYISQDPHALHHMVPFWANQYECHIRG